MALVFNPDTGGTLTDDLVAYWKLDEASGTRIDVVGANDLTDNNTVGQATGIVNDAAQFVAANSEYLDIADNADLSMGDISFSLALWVYFDTKPISASPIGKWNQVDDQREYRLRYIGGGTDRLQFEVSSTGGGGLSSVNADNFGSPSTGEWIFVVCWHDATGDAIGIQVNNGTANTAAHTGGVFDGTSRFALGANVSGGSPINPWDGRIDETGVWKRVLNTQEKTDLYNGGAGNTPENVSIQTIDGLTTVLEGIFSQTIDTDTDIITNQGVETIDAETSVDGATEVTIDAITTVLELVATETIDADTDILETQPSQTINAETLIQATITQTIDSNTFVKQLGVTQAIGANSTILLQPAQTINANTDILVREVNLQLFKESDLSTPVGTASNPLDFGVVEAGTTELHADNPFLLFNDKGNVLNSFDAREVTISVVQFNIENELQGTSNGTADQSFTVAFPPALDNDELITVKVNDISWVRVSTFAGSGPTSEVYTFDATTGEIVFGDGIQGKIPPMGESVKASYTPDTLLYGKQVVEQLWLGVQSNEVVANNLTVELEERVPTDTTHVTVIHRPKVVDVTGVWLGTDPNRLGTNYFTGGGFDDQSGVVTLGTAIPGGTPTVLIDYEYTIEDDAEGGFTQVNDTTTHEFANPIPSGSAKKLNFLVTLPSSASSSGGGTVKFKVRFSYRE